MEHSLSEVATQPMHTAVAPFLSQDGLVLAVRELHRLGFDNEQLSVLAKDRQATAEVARAEGVPAGTDSPDTLGYDSEPKGRPEFIGMAIGGTAGVLLALTAIVIPGFGPFLVSGGIATMALHMATVGAGGVGIGALLGAIFDERITETHRDDYEAMLESGHWLLVVHGNAETITHAKEALTRVGAAQVDTF